MTKNNSPLTIKYFSFYLIILSVLPTFLMTCFKWNKTTTFYKKKKLKKSGVGVSGNLARIKDCSKSDVPESSKSHRISVKI